jgi:type IV secretion system protein VirB4
LSAQKKRASSSLLRHRDTSRERDLESYRDIADDVIESDFVPYACLQDASSIATKNGEVMQIIRITGLGFDSKDQGDLRSAIRNAIARCIPDTSYAIWLHTLRRKQSLLEAATFPDTFSAEVDNAWRKEHPTQASFVNELYITVVKAAQQANITSVQSFMQSLWPPRDRTVRTQYLERALKELTVTTDKMLEVLRPFGARLLTTVEREGVFYGEHLEFLEKLINLESRPMAIPRRDLSQVLTSGEITFSYNAMEVRTAEEHRRFGSIITIKEYKESSLAGIDQFLEIPCELIVTQCFDFVGAQSARSAYEQQASCLAISGDSELARWIEIDRLTNRNMNTDKSFGEQQTSVFLIAPSVKQLENNVRMAQKALNRLGVVAIREDLRFEDCYWAQLPGNFPFIARRHSTDTQHLAGFSNLQRQPMGNALGSSWGVPVSLLSTVQGTPYFFNFHRGRGAEGSAHTVILGSEGSGHTTLAHFLISQARKLKLNIWYFDTHGRAEPMVRAMGGQYLKPGSAELRLNPFAMEPTPTNRTFLALWLSTLIDPYGQQLNTSSIAFFQQMVDAVLGLPPSQRRLSALIPIVREQDAMLANTLQRWVAGGAYGELFDMPGDQFSAATLTAWNLAPWAKSDETMIPLMSYLLHRATSALDGTPTLIVCDEGFHALKTPLFGPRAVGWLDFLTQNNAAALLMTSDVAGSSMYNFSASIAAKAASIFAMPQAEPDVAYATFGFTEDDFGALNYMKSAEHHILLKRGNESTLVKLNLSNLNASSRATLSGRAEDPQKSPAETLAELMGVRAGVAV